MRTAPHQHSPAFINAVVQAYGTATMPDVAERFGLTPSAVSGIWQRAVREGKLKRTRWAPSSREHIERVLSFRGRMSGAEAGRVLGLSKNVVLGVWRYHGSKESAPPTPIVSNLARDLGIEAVQVRMRNLRPTSSHDSEYVTISLPRVRCLEDA